jgi:hypothetical protein
MRDYLTLKILIVQYKILNNSLCLDKFFFNLGSSDITFMCLSIENTKIY